MCRCCSIHDLPRGMNDDGPDTLKIYPMSPRFIDAAIAAAFSVEGPVDFSTFSEQASQVSPLAGAEYASMAGGKVPCKFGGGDVFYCDTHRCTRCTYTDVCASS